MHAVTPAFAKTCETCTGPITNGTLLGPLEDMRSVMVAAVAVFLPLAAAWDPPECHEYLAQQAKLEGAHEAVLKD